METVGTRLSKCLGFRSFAVDPSRLPQEVDATAPRPLARLGSLIAVWFLVLTGIPFLIIVILHQEGTPWWVYPLLAVLPTTCSVALVTCRIRLRQSLVIHFDEDGVRVTEKGIRKTRSWSSPYADFRGLALRHALPEGRPDGGKFHVVELIHGNSENHVPLMVTQDPSDAERGMKRYSDQFGLPVLETAGGAGAGP